MGFIVTTIAESTLSGWPTTVQLIAKISLQLFENSKMKFLLSTQIVDLFNSLHTTIVPRRFNFKI